MQSEVFHRPPTGRAHDAGPVRIVHDHRDAGLLRYLVELGKRSQVPVHAEHAVRDDQRGAGSPPALQEPRQLRMVPVAIHPQRGVAEAARVNQAGVAEPVGVDDGAVFRQCGDQAQVRLVSGREHQSGLDALEGRQARFQLPMGTQTPGYQP